MPRPHDTYSILLTCWRPAQAVAITNSFINLYIIVQSSGEMMVEQVSRVPRRQPPFPNWGCVLVGRFEESSQGTDSM
jgi:hypothetical protein